MNKRILVFGAGTNQILLIKACRELGYYTVATDPNPNAPGASLADLFTVLSPKDFQAHCRLIEKERIGGLVSCQMENPLSLMARLAEKYGFLFPKPEVIRRARDKNLMKQAFLAHKVPCARGLVIDSIEHLRSQDLSDWDFPMIIKPVDSFSSRGVVRVASRSALLAHFKASASHSSNGQVLVEEFLEGPEVSVESVTFQGDTTIIQITDKVITPYPHTVELAHFQPSELDENICRDIRQLVKRAIKAIGINNSGSHAELKITAQGPKMIEIGARLGGDYISSYLTSLSTGVDMNRAVAQIAMGELPELDFVRRCFSGIQYVNWEAGKKVKRIQPLETFLENPKVAFADIFVNSGDILPPITESTSRHSFFITSAASKDELNHNIESLTKALSDLLTHD